MSLLPGDIEQHLEMYLMVTTGMGEGMLPASYSAQDAPQKRPVWPHVSSAEVGLTNYLDLSVGLFFFFGCARWLMGS